MRLEHNVVLCGKIEAETKKGSYRQEGSNPYGVRSELARLYNKASCKEISLEVTHLCDLPTQHMLATKFLPHVGMLNCYLIDKK